MEGMYVARINGRSLMMLIGGFALFLWEQKRGTGLAELRTMMVNVIVVVEMFYLLNCRSLTRLLTAIPFFSNPWALVGLAVMAGAQLLFTYAPVMNRLFHSAPISGTAWLKILALGMTSCLIVELKKWRDGRLRKSSCA